MPEKWKIKNILMFKLGLILLVQRIVEEIWIPAGAGDASIHQNFESGWLFEAKTNRVRTARIGKQRLHKI